MGPYFKYFKYSGANDAEYWHKVIKRGTLLHDGLLKFYQSFRCFEHYCCVDYVEATNRDRLKEKQSA